MLALLTLLCLLSAAPPPPQNTGDGLVAPGTNLLLGYLFVATLEQ